MTRLQDIPVTELLPQRPPFLFVDTLEAFTETSVRSSFTVPQEGELVEDGHLRSAGLLEHMAQTSALRIGYLSVYVRHVPVRIGYIGQFKGLKINRLPQSGERIVTDLTVRSEVFGITLAEVVVRSGEEILATASLKTALTDESE